MEKSAFPQFMFYIIIKFLLLLSYELLYGILVIKVILLLLGKWENIRDRGTQDSFRGAIFLLSMVN